MSNKSDLLLRYEKMLRGEGSSWFDADEFDDIALEYEMSSKLEDALLSIETGLKYHPSSQELKTRKAYYLLVLGKVEEARDVMSEVTTLDDDAQCIRVELLLIDGNIDTAVDIVKHLLNAPNITSDFILNIIDICADYKLFSDLFLSIISAINNIESQQQLPILRDFISILEELSETEMQAQIIEKILDKEPYSLPDWIKAIETYILLSDLPKALDAIEYALVIDATNSEVLFYKAYCIANQGNEKEAISLLEDNNIKKDENIYMLLATCYANMNEYAKSIDILEDMLKTYSHNSRSLYLMAHNIYNLYHDNDNVIDLLKKSLEEEPYDSETIYFLAKVYYEIEDYYNAHETIKNLDLEESNWDNLKMFTLYGDILIKSGMQEEAIWHYKKVCEVDKYDLEIYFKIIYAYSEMHDVENMHKNISRAEEIIAYLDYEKKLTKEEEDRVSYIRDTINKIKVILRNHIDDKI